MIEAGEVMVDGKICKNPLLWVNPQKARITVGEKQAKPSATRILLLYKTRGTITTKKDPEGRPTVFDLLPEEFHDLKPVGRLDQHTSGLLIFTSNNQLLNYLLDPESEIEREYDISVEGLLENIEPLLRGIEDQGELLRLKACNIRKQSRRETHLKVILNEGKNREIRRVMSHLGLEVSRLIRVKYGEYELGDLKEGEVREV